MNKVLLITLAIACLLSGCKSSHLDLLPALDDPTLIEQTFTVEQLHQDMDALLEGAIARHPELSAYADLTLLNATLSQYKSQITTPMTRAEFYRVIGKMSHLFGDGHSFLIWPYQEFEQLKEQGHQPFPFAVAISKTGEIILKDSYTAQEHSVSAGMKIHSINGVPAHELLTTMAQYTGGETKLLREHVVAHRFATGLWAVYGFIDKFQLELINNHQLTQLSLTPEQNWQPKQSVNGRAYYYKQLQPSVGYLYLEHFDIEPDVFEEFIDETFARIRQDNIASLVIDIRNNPGGNTDTVTYLTRYLANKPFRLVSSVREKLNQHNRGWFNFKGEVGEIVEHDWSDWHSPIGNGNQFTGSSYLLVGPISYSAAIVLATTLKDNEFATLVGQTTGGFANQTAQGNLFNLPHSQLRAYIATRSLVRPNGDLTRQGVQPHYIAYNEVQDIQAHKDVGIERVLALIASKQ